MTGGPFPHPLRGYKRSWVQCKECGWVGYYDYMPYGLSSPIVCLPCGHGIGVSHFPNTVNYINETVARAIIKREQMLREELCAAGDQVRPGK